VERFVPKPVALLDPGAGLPATYVPSQGEIECVRAVTFLLTTSNAVANRRGVVRFLAICVLDAEHNQASVSVVSDFLAGLRERVNTVKVSTLALES